MEDIKCAGGIVLGEGGTVVLVRTHGREQWLFPKGKLEEGETLEECARREIEEETGLTNLEYLDDLGSYKRPRISRDGTDINQEMKSIHMFLFSAHSDKSLSPTKEIAEAKWFSYRDLAENIGNEKDRVWFASVFNRVREAIQRD